MYLLPIFIGSAMRSFRHSIRDLLSCQRSGGLAISFAEIKLLFAKVASISWGRCKVKNKGDGKPEKSQGPVLQRYIRSTSLRFPSDDKANG